MIKRTKHKSWLPHEILPNTGGSQRGEQSTVKWLNEI